MNEGFELQDSTWFLLTGVFIRNPTLLLKLMQSVTEVRIPSVNDKSSQVMSNWSSHGKYLGLSVVVTVPPSPTEMCFLFRYGLVPLGKPSRSLALTVGRI